MVVYRNISTTVLGAAPLDIDLGGSGYRDVYVTVVETAGVSYTAQWAGPEGLTGVPLPVGAGATFQLKYVPELRFLEFVGAGATLTGVVADCEVNPSALAVAGTVNVNLVTDSVGLAKSNQLPTTLDASGGLKTDAGQDTIITDPTSPTGKALAVKQET